MSQRIRVQKIIRSLKNLALKKFVPKRILVPKQFRSQKNFVPKKIWVPSRFGSQKNLGSKKIDKFRVPKLFGSQKFLSPENFGLKKIMSRKNESPEKICVQKNLVPKRCHKIFGFQKIIKLGKVGRVTFQTPPRHWKTKSSKPN